MHFCCLSQIWIIWTLVQRTKLYTGTENASNYSTILVLCDEWITPTPYWPSLAFLNPEHLRYLLEMCMIYVVFKCPNLSYNILHRDPWLIWWHTLIPYFVCDWFVYDLIWVIQTDVCVSFFSSSLFILFCEKAVLRGGRQNQLAQHFWEPWILVRPFTTSKMHIPRVLHSLSRKGRICKKDLFLFSDYHLFMAKDAKSWEQKHLYCVKTRLYRRI